MRKNLLNRIFSLVMVLSWAVGLVAPTQALAAPASVGLEKPAAQAPALIPTVEPELQSQIAANPNVGYLIYLRDKADLSTADKMSWVERGEFVMKSLQATASASQAKVIAYLDAQKADYQSFWIDNIILVNSSDLNTFNGLLNFPEIESLRARRTEYLIDPQVVPTAEAPTTVEPNIEHVGAPGAWALGIDGAGMTVSSIDTGVRYTHDALEPHYRGFLGGSTFDHNYNWWDPYGDHPASPGDDHGHGSHTMGTMVGDDGGANQIGMAPGAEWIACRGCNTSSCTDTALLECAQFIAAPWNLSEANPDPSKRPNAVNNSWGDCLQYYDDWYQGVVDSWQAAGIYPVFSNGNSSNCGYSSPPGLNTVGNPARYGNVTGVGASTRDTGAYATFSNWGPTDNPDSVNPNPNDTLGAALKPQVIAPGSNIRSSVNTGDSDYQGGWSGTSMSAPHVTALVAMLWQAAPCLVGDYAVTETLIENTATPIPYASGGSPPPPPGNVPNYATGHGEINALAAVTEALTTCGDSTLAGTVTDAITTDPIVGARVTASGADGDHETLTNLNGEYSISLYAGLYDVTAEAFAYQPETATDVELVTGQTTTQNFALDPAPTYLLSGYVTDADTGWPLYAHISIDGFPGDAIWTNPETGFYSIELPGGIEYTLNVSAFLPGYIPESRDVGPLIGATDESFELEADPESCSAPGRHPDCAYYANFEGNNGGFTVSGTSSFAWGAPTSGPGAAHSGNNVWATNLSGPYNVNENGYLTSPLIDLSAYTGQGFIFSWWQWLQSEANYDYASIEVSNNGGASWTTVYGPVSGSINTTWTGHEIALDASYAVSNFQFRFHFLSDSSVTYPGWYIDDICLAPVVIPPPIYSENFDVSNGGFSVDPSSVNSSWAWGTPTSGPGAAHSAPNVWATNLAGNYPLNSDDYLVSPDIDLSAYTGSTLAISWWQWLQTESCCDPASVQVSNNGGVSWTTVYTAKGNINLTWAQHMVELDSSYAVSNFRVRFYLHSDYSITYPGWYIDDISISVGVSTEIPCVADPGGLVVGNVYDANTDLPLVDALVVNDAGAGFVTIATPDDSNLDDGFYTLFSAPLSHVFTATMEGGYLPDVETVDVVEGDTVLQDFSLEAGMLEASPDSLHVTLDMGATADTLLTLSNMGTGPLFYEISELDQGYVPSAASQGWDEPLAQPAANPAGIAVHNGPISSAPSRTPFIHHGTSPMAINIIAYADDTFHTPTAVEQALDALSLTYTFFGYDASGANLSAFVAALEGGDWDLVILAEDSWTLIVPTEYDAVQAHLAAGGMAIVESWGIPYDVAHQTHPLWGDMGMSYGSGINPVTPLYWWDPTHPMLNGVPEFTDLDDLSYFFYGARMNLVDPPVAVALGGFATTPTPGENGIVLRDDNLSIYKGLIDAPNAADLNSNGIPDVTEWWTNAVGYILNPSTDVPWLSEAPSQGFLDPAPDSQVVTVSFDASVVGQPGDYLADLKISSDTPYEVTTVPVTMTVNASATSGKLEGTVTGLGYCDANPAPLAKAEVFIEGSDGFTLTLVTDDAGFFQWWLDETHNPLTVTVTAADHTTGVATDVEIVAGMTTVQDFSLRWLMPCASTTPTSLEATVALGYTDTKTLSVNNNGAGDLIWELRETNTPLVAVDQVVTVSVPAIPAADAGVASRSNLSGQPAKQFAVHINQLSTQTIDVLLVTPDVVGGGDISLLLNTLAAFPDLNVTLWDAEIGTPTVADMQGYDVVFVGNDYLWTVSAIDKVTLSNNLADYIDAGGKVLVGSFIWSYDDWGFGGGRFITEDYSPFEVSSSDIWNPAALGTFDPTSPLMEGITAVTDNFNHQDPALSSTGVWVASWDDDENFVASSPNVVGLNQEYFGAADFGGQTGELLHNALLFLGAQQVDVPWLTEVPTNGVTLADSVFDVDVSFDSMTYTVGTYTATLILTSDDPVSPELSIPVTMHVVNPVAPTASFTSNSPVFVGEEMMFTNTSTPGIPPETTFEWNFGDGTVVPGTMDPITHLYATAGTYTVSLKACNPAAMCNTFTAQVVVKSRMLFLPVINKN